MATIFPRGRGCFVVKLKFERVFEYEKQMEAKITMRGKYLPFYGWSTVAMVNPGNEGDTLQEFPGTLGFVEDFYQERPHFGIIFFRPPHRFVPRYCL